MENRTIIIKGRVQGVGYRYWTADKCRELQLKGFVRNQSDGSVMVEIEGPGEKIDQFLFLCKEGPVRAIVKTVEYYEGSLKNYSGFSIR